MERKWTFALLLLLSVAVGQAWADTYTGVLVDSVSNEPLPFANVAVVGTTRGTSTDNDGVFTINANMGEKLEFSYLGYNTKTIKLTTKGKVSEQTGRPVLTLRVKLAETEGEQLQEIVVTKQRYKYSKKNKAVDFVTNAIRLRDQNALTNADYYQRTVYEQTKLGLTNVKIKEGNKSTVQQLILQSDSSIFSQHPVLYFSNTEKNMDQLYRRSPQTNKTIVNGINRVSLEDQLLGEGATDQFTNQFFKEINIYSPTINIAFKDFISPLSSIAPSFYKFFIQDTVTVDSLTCVRIAFAPMNNAQLGFIGHLDIVDPSLMKDSTAAYTVKQVEMNIHQEIAINWLDNLRITQNFNLNDEGIMELSSERIAAEFYIIKGVNGIYAERKRDISKYIFHQKNDSIMRSIEGAELVLPTAADQDSTFWAEQRAETGNAKDSRNVETLVNDLKSSSGTSTLLYVIETIIKAYLRTSNPSYFDIGPIYTFLAGGQIEGFRLKFAGETTANLCPYVFLSGYGAYGFGDHRWKFGGTAEFSFNKKTYHPREWPVHSITLNYTRDTRTLGEEPRYTVVDNMFYAIKRMGITNVIYYDKAQITYEYEHRSHFSLKLNAFQEWMYPSDDLGGTIFFQKADGTLLPLLHHNEVGLTLRYAPKETFVQGRMFRFPTKNPHPTFSIQHRASFQGLFGAEYGYQATEVRYAQHIFFPSYGSMDIWLKAGKIWTGDCPYPYLFTPNSNTSFTVVNESFSMVNPLEFLADQYVSLDLMFYTYLLFNSIPYVKKAHLREVFGFSMYWGHLSNKNNPTYNNNLLAFPEYSMAMPMNMPYMEFSVGIANILNLIRLEYVRRINFLDSPSIQRNPMGANGIRFVFDFEF